MAENVYLGRDVKFNYNTNDIVINQVDDVQNIVSNNNLEQAIINRLKTPKGSLSRHPEYGAELDSIIGSRKNALTISQIRQLTRDALLQEPRIQTINSITAKFRDGFLDVVDIGINVTPINSTETLNIIYPFILQ